MYGGIVIHRIERIYSKIPQMVLDVAQLPAFSVKAPIAWSAPNHGTSMGIQLYDVS